MAVVKILATPFRHHRYLATLDTFSLNPINAPVPSPFWLNLLS